MKKHLYLLVPIVVVLIIAMFAFAQPRKGMHGGMMGQGMGYGYQQGGGCPMAMGGMHGGSMGAMFYLDMTDSQINQLIDQYSSFMKDHLQTLRQRAELQKQLYEIRSSDDPDIEKLRDVRVKLSNINADLEAEALQARKKAMNILTEEQREKLGDMPMPFFGGRGQGFLYDRMSDDDMMRGWMHYKGPGQWWWDDTTRTRNR